MWGAIFRNRVHHHKQCEASKHPTTESWAAYKKGKSYRNDDIQGTEAGDIVEEVDNESVIIFKDNEDWEDLSDSDADYKSEEDDDL